MSRLVTGESAGRGCMERFEIGSGVHVVTVLACLAAIALAVLLGRRWQRLAPRRERALRAAWVVFVVAFQVGSQVWQNLPDNFRLRYTLPLHPCDLVVVALPFALLTAAPRTARTLLWFWGAGLGPFAFALPILREGPVHPAFWLFWIGHLQILGSAVYLPAVRGWRPRLRDAGVAWLVTAGYTALMLPLDLALDADYGSVGPDPSATEMLGPWPVRVGVLLVLEGILFVLLWLPWARAPRSTP